jgi:hypothetical protein
VERGESTTHADDQAGTGRQRVSVAEAATILNTTVEGVRSRIKRGTLESVKERGAVYVLLSPDQLPTGPQPDADQSADRTGDLVDELRARIAFLEAELERRGEAEERLHRIMAGLTQTAAQLSSRVPELEAPTSQAPSSEAEDAPESPPSPGPNPTPAPTGAEREMATEMPMGPTPAEASEEAHEDTEPRRERSWWRQLFGLE